MTSDAFLVLFLAFLVIIMLFPALLRRFGVSSVIALLIAGMVIGPNGLDMLGFMCGKLSFLPGDPATVYQRFDTMVMALASLGLVFLMALAGMEADFKMLRSVRTPVLLLSVSTFTIPAVAGYFVYRYFNPDDLPGKLLYASLFASHSVGIVFPVIRELKISKTRFGSAVLISTVITDVASIVLLAISVQMKKVALGAASAVAGKGLSIFDYLDPAWLGGWFLAVFLVMVLLYMAFSIWIVSRIGKFLMAHVFDADTLITLFLLLILGTVVAGELLGVNLVVGAFISGMALSVMLKSPLGNKVFQKFEGIGYGLLIPFLFINIGMSTNFAAFAKISNIQIVLFTVIGLVVSKIGSGYLAMRFSKFDRVKSVCAGLMTVPQLSATLAAAAIGKSLGMLDDNFFNAVVVLSIVTTLPVPGLVRYLIVRYQVDFRRISVEGFRIPRDSMDDLL